MIDYLYCEGLDICLEYFLKVDFICGTLSIRVHLISFIFISRF